jgi:ubiquinone/menaquinone biosynthesis C-methylase UbiE
MSMNGEPGKSTRGSESGRAYDSLASRYDNLLLENPVLAHSAAVSLGLVKMTMASSRRLLEIGCGTGRETLELASAGKEVVACDPSTESLAVLRKKARDRGVSERVLTRSLAASQVEHLVDEFGEHSFDGAYASFSLSYEPDLSIVPEQVWKLLKPGSHFLCSIFNRVCISELVLLAPFLVPRRALRRLEGWTHLPVDTQSVVVKSYTPGQVRRIFARRFSLCDIWAIPAIIPPHYLHLVVRLSGPLRTAWEELDVRLNHRWPFRYLGSHTCYDFQAIG